MVLLLLLLEWLLLRLFVVVAREEVELLLLRFADEVARVKLCIPALVVQSGPAREVAADVAWETCRPLLKLSEPQRGVIWACAAEGEEPMQAGILFAVD